MVRSTSAPRLLAVDVDPGLLQSGAQLARRKIEPVASEPRDLVSVRGTGYRFDG